MPAWVAVVVGMLIAALGVSRLYVAGSIRKTTLSWSRRENHDNDLSGSHALYDQSTVNTVLGIGGLVLGLVIAGAFAIRYL
jgi:hypothetical protein